jgi:hypothetical protein
VSHVLARRPAARIAVIAALLLVVGLVAARANLWYEATDFSCLYQAARSVELGRDPYDPVWWATATGGLHANPWLGLVGTSCAAQYAYPLWTAVLMLPFGLLPIEAAATLWMAVSIGAAIFGARALWIVYGGTRRSAALYATLVFMSQPFWLLLVSGQITGVMLGLLGALALGLARARGTLAGTALALLALKPQIVVLTLPVMLVRLAVEGRRRVVATAIVVGVVMLALPLLAVPAWPIEWLGQVGKRGTQIAALLPTAWGFSADVLGDPAWGAVTCVVVVGASAVLAKRADALSLLALSVPLSLVVTLHAWSYDFLLLAGPWAFVLGRLGRLRGPAPVALLACLVGVSSLLPWLLYAVAFTRGSETLSMVIPAATALLAAGVTRMTPATR